MNNLEILQYVDHSQLKAVTTWEDIKTLCEEAIEYNTASICVPPCYVKRIRDTYASLNICTVIGFPLGYNVKEVKLAETKQAILDGADEIDMVINLTDVKNKLYNNIEEEIKAIKELIGDKVLKVIIETCYLTQDEKVELCNIVTKSNANYIKTSTGFGLSGATLDDIKLLKQHIGKDTKIKAAGGIKGIQEMKTYIKEGCNRIGTSSAIQAIKGHTAKGY